MHNILLLLIGLLVGACSETPTSIISNPNMMKEALLRSRNVYSIDKNIDYYNPARIAFYQQYSEQLIELNFKTERMNNYQLTVVNSDSMSKLKLINPDIQLGELAIEMNGQNITDCVIAECNATKCLGTDINISSFSGEISTSTLYLNLTKMAQSPSLQCSSLDFSLADKFHTIVFREATPVNDGFKGARLKAQVIVYNRTNRPFDIKNIFNQ